MSRRRREPLRTTLSERLGRPVVAPAIPPRPEPVLGPGRPASEVLALLMAVTGLRLAARADAEVELLPGTPTTVVLTVAGRARAAFVLPADDAELRHALGQPRPPRRDLALERLWHEDQQDHGGETETDAC